MAEGMVRRAPKKIGAYVARGKRNSLLDCVLINQLALNSSVRFATGRVFKQDATHNTLITLELLGPLRRDRLNVWVRMFSKKLRSRIKPRTSFRGAAHATLAIALTTGLDPDNAIDVLVIGLGGRGLSKAGLDIAPVAPVVAGTWEGDTALINDEAGGKALSLEGRGEVRDEVALVVGLAAISDGFGGFSGKSIVVGDVGGKAADTGTVGPPNNVGELGGS